MAKVAVVRLTEREQRILTLAGEQYGLPMDVVARVAGQDLATSSAEAVARRIAGRLERGGLARREREADGVWLVPTARGLREADLDYTVWAPAGWKLAHHATVVRIRLHLEGRFPEVRWESERAIRRRLREVGGRGRRADGGLWWPDGTATGVEVERFVKSRRPPGVLSGEDRYADIVRQADPAWNAGIWWFCPARQVERLAKRLAAAGGGQVHQVYPFPAGVAS